MNQLKPGGGGLHTATALSDLAETSPIKLHLHYIDVSEEDKKIITRHFDHWQIGHTFFGLRPGPLNAVVGGSDDKYIFKGPPLPREGVEEQIRKEEQKFKSAINSVLEGSKGVVINSAKDIRFVELILASAQERGIPLYFNITDSLPSDFVFKRILPSGVGIINQEDIISLYGENPLHFNDKQLKEYALELMRRIIRGGVNNSNPLYVTLGKYGTYCVAADGGVYHVVLKDGYAPRVSHSALTNVGSTTGAGDSFTAAVVYNTTLFGRDADPREVAKMANAFSIKHIKYQGPLRGAFDVVLLN